MEQADKNSNTHFEFETYDTYQWYLDLGRSPIQHEISSPQKFLMELYRSIIRIRRFLEERGVGAAASRLNGTQPALADSGIRRSLGPWQIFRRAEEQDPEHTNFIVCRSMVSRQWQTPKADSIGLILFRT